MNDRYLYRAKRTDNGEWITGYLLVKKKDFYICEKPYECMDEYSSLNGQSYGFGGFKLVDPSTICQCTGLKDKNGKLIWENDVVKEEFKAIGVVHYGMYDYNIGFNIKWVNEYGLAYRREVCYWAHEVEIIGNTIDNPEL